MPSSASGSLWLMQHCLLSWNYFCSSEIDQLPVWHFLFGFLAFWLSTMEPQIIWPAKVWNGASWDYLRSSTGVRIIPNPGKCLLVSSHLRCISIALVSKGNSVTRFERGYDHNVLKSPFLKFWDQVTVQCDRQILFTFLFCSCEDLIHFYLPWQTQM